MAFSGYQIERLIDRLRRWGLLPWRGQGSRGEGDRVCLSPEADRAREGQPFGIAPPPDYPTASPATLRDPAVRDLRVEHELERRAGRFMQPPVAPQPPLPPIPRAAPPRRPTEPGSEEDTSA